MISKYHVIMIIVIGLLLVLFVQYTIGDYNARKAVMELGCDIEYIGDMKVCQISNQYYFIDVDCTNNLIPNCTAMLITGPYIQQINKEMEMMKKW